MKHLSLPGYKPFGRIRRGVISFIDQLKQLWRVTRGRVQYRLPAHWQDEWVDDLGILRQPPVPHPGPPAPPQNLLMDLVSNGGTVG